MKTKFTELTGVKYPVMSGGMMWVSTKELVSAVANAGGFGVMTGLSFGTPDLMVDEIRKLRKMTDNPFGINITFLPTLKPVPYGDFVDAALAEGIRIFETAGRSPEDVMPALKAANAKVIHKCTSLKHALKAQALGVDMVSVDGFECAGHPGEDDVTSLVLLPIVAEALDIPVIASGGFGDGRGLVAAMALGAEGINMGTRFLATKEAPVHENIKNNLVNTSEKDTKLILRTLKNTARVLSNKTSNLVVSMEAEGKGIMDLAPHLSGLKGKVALETGDLENAILTAGQVAGLIHDIPSVQELIETIVADAKRIINNRLPSMV
ncbi:MAG: nitronate monooxygenase [SAR324 cluster bacterium]|nr:nitronate monooxygenase [SAR324 cluster bacterium]